MKATFNMYRPECVCYTSNNVNTVEWLVSVSAVLVFVGSALTISFSIASRDYTFDGVLLWKFLKRLWIEFRV